MYVRQYAATHKYADMYIGMYKLIYIQYVHTYIAMYIISTLQQHNS